MEFNEFLTNCVNDSINNGSEPPRSLTLMDIYTHLCAIGPSHEVWAHHNAKAGSVEIYESAITACVVADGDAWAIGSVDEQGRHRGTIRFHDIAGLDAAVTAIFGPSADADTVPLEVA
jgi:hypothetical protein